MKESTSVLKQLNEQVGGVEGVDRVMDALREEREKVEEVAGVISEGGGLEGVDEGEVEEEFEKLMEAERPQEDVDTKERKEQQSETQSMQLPDVPLTEPAAAGVEIGFRAMERPQREQAEEDMEKRLSAMSLDEEPIMGKDNGAEGHGTSKAPQTDTMME